MPLDLSPVGMGGIELPTSRSLAERHTTCLHSVGVSLFSYQKVKALALEAKALSCVERTKDLAEGVILMQWKFEVEAHNSHSTHYRPLMQPVFKIIQKQG